MRIACTGYRGRVGKVFLSESPDVVPLECDVRNPLEIQKAIKYTKPDLVVHLAAKSDVDFCQKLENRELVIQTNLDGTFNVAEATMRYGCGMVLLSTDHVFSGKRWFGKYKENDTPYPVNDYGLSKLAAEQLRSAFDNLKVVRTSSLFDESRIMAEQGKMGATAYPVFLKRSFIYLPHFVHLFYAYCQRFAEQPKVLHLAGIDTVSYYEFMLDVAKELNLSMKVQPRRDDLQNGFAPRGYNLGLDVSLSMKLGFHRFSYLDGLREMK